VQKPEELKTRRALFLPPSSVSPDAVSSFIQRQYKEESVEALQQGLADQLRLSLSTTGLFRSVELATTNGSAGSELTLRLELRRIWQGSASTIVPLVARSDPSELEISGVITSGDASDLKPALEFLCRSSTGGVILKPKHWMHDNVAKVAESVKKLLMKVTREPRAAAAPIIGTPARSATLSEMVWLYPPSDWAKMGNILQRGLDQAGLKLPSSQLREAVSEISSDGTVVGILVTRENAERLFLTYSRVLSANKGSAVPLDGTYVTGPKLYQIFRKAEESNQRMIWVWYAKKGVTHWSRERIDANTLLIDANTGMRLKPIATWIPLSYVAWMEMGCRGMGCVTLDAATVYNSAIFIFPARGAPPDAAEPFELRTEMDNRSVVLRF
jgi:hypothetical protein